MRWDGRFPVCPYDGRKDQPHLILFSVHRPDESLREMGASPSVRGTQSVCVCACGHWPLARRRGNMGGDSAPDVHVRPGATVPHAQRRWVGWRPAVRPGPRRESWKGVATGGLAQPGSVGSKRRRPPLAVRAVLPYASHRTASTARGLRQERPAAADDGTASLSHSLASHHMAFLSLLGAQPTHSSLPPSFLEWSDCTTTTCYHFLKKIVAILAILEWSDCSTTTCYSFLKR